MDCVDAEIDLHSYAPGQVRLNLLPFLDRGYAENWERVRIIHGQGEGIIKGRVHEILDEISYISEFRNARRDEGGAGATIAIYGRH